MAERGEQGPVGLNKAVPESRLPHQDSHPSLLNSIINKSERARSLLPNFIPSQLFGPNTLLKVMSKVFDTVLREIKGVAVRPTRFQVMSGSGMSSLYIKYLAPRYALRDFHGDLRLIKRRVCFELKTNSSFTSLGQAEDFDHHQLQPAAEA